MGQGVISLPCGVFISNTELPREKESNQMKIQTKAKCVECSRIFDLLDESQAEEWYYGHDCEVE